jgi:hypothetical protein
MLKDEVITFAGDVSIRKAEIVSQNGTYHNIIPQIINVQIYEDLFSPFITGSIIVRESLDFANLFPLVGEEIVNLEIATPSLGKKLKGQFFIYKMSDRDTLGDKSVVFQLHIISRESVIDLNKKISKPFSGKVSEIATQILNEPTVGLETDKNVIVEPTANSTKYISNFWSPVQNLNYLCSNALNRNKSPTYLFFENREGLNFLSLDTLYTPEILQTFVNDKYARDNQRGGGGSIKNIDEDFKRIQQIRIPQTFDYMDRISSGMQASNLILYDFTKKQYSVKTFDMLKGYDENKHMNFYPVISNNQTRRADSTILRSFRYYANFSGYGDVTNNNSIQKRISLLKQAESFKVEIVVPGRWDYTVGKKVNLQLTRIEPLAKEDIDTKDKLYSGTYLIAAINHYVSKEKHECNIELIRESLNLNLNKKSK